VPVIARHVQEAALPIRKWTISLISLLAIAAFPGCSSSNSLTLQNPPAPATTPVSIAFQPAPAPSLDLASTTNVTAVVSNDASYAGVDWALLCTNTTNCGKLSSLHTASGTATTYKPPASIAGNTQSITIEAFATADHNQNVLATLSVTAFASNLKGTYVFQAQGEDGNSPFAVAGVVVLDGNGKVTLGEQTHADSLISLSDVITGGAYYIGPDGRGTLTIDTADQAIGQLGVENFSLVFLSSSKALIATLDDPLLSAQSFEISQGTLELQSTPTAPTGGYAFAVNGIDIISQPTAMGGVLNIDSPNIISGAGSIADQDDAGSVVPNSTLSGTVTTPDSLGALKFNLATGFAPSLQFTGYIVDATHIKLIESDNQGSGIGFGITAGQAIGQGSATGTFTRNSAFAGNYVFNILGQDLSALLTTSLASVGVFTADASGNLTAGFNDEFLSGLAIEVSDSLTGTYTLDPSGNGRIDSDITFQHNGAGPELIFYLTGNGNPPLILDADVNFGSLGTGAAHPQAQPPFAFSGKYGLEFIQSNGTIENSGTGQATADHTPATLTGMIDTNLNFSPQPNTPLTGSFATIPTNGVFTGTLDNTFFPTPGTVPNTIAVTFYEVDPNNVFFIETDSSTSAELSVGYLAARTSVCPTCQ
jgi:hypothetical protein